MSYMDWTAKLKIDLDPGVHTLTGNQSMGFVRYRHDELGDIGRVQRQQIFLQAAMRKMMDPRSWPHVPALVKIARQSINTDMSDMQIFECLNFVRGVPKSSFKFVMLPGQFAGNGDWVATTDARTLALHMASPDQDLVSSRRNLSVCVINTTTDPNMGGKVARALGKLGYIASVGKDQPDVPFAHTRIIAQYGNTADAEMLKADLGGTGEVVNASVGNLNTALTVFARSDIDPEKVTLSSVDAPYVPPTGMPQPLVVNPHADRPSRPHLGDAPPPIDSSASVAPPDVEQRVVDTAPGAGVDTNGADNPGAEDGTAVKSGGRETAGEEPRETREAGGEQAPTPGTSSVQNPSERLRRNENNSTEVNPEKPEGTKGGAALEGGANIQ